MIKRCLSIILAVMIMITLSSSALGGSTSSPSLEPSRAESRDDTEHLPTINLKGVKLRGTAISGLFKPIAIIEHTDIKDNRWYRVGDTLCGGSIVEIQRGSLVLEMNGGRYLFGLPEGAIEGLGPASGEEKVAFGKKVGENFWKVKLDAAIEMLTRVNKIMKEARIRPHFAIGKAAGIRIDRIKEESVISQMGLEDGDIIKGVNGFGLMSPTRVFEAYRRYKKDRLIQVQLIRNDEPLTLTYNIVR